MTKLGFSVVLFSASLSVVALPVPQGMPLTPVRSLSEEPRDSGLTLLKSLRDAETRLNGLRAAGFLKDDKGAQVHAKALNAACLNLALVLREPNRDLKKLSAEAAIAWKTALDVDAYLRADARRFDVVLSNRDKDAMLRQQQYLGKTLRSATDAAALAGVDERVSVALDYPEVAKAQGDAFATPVEEQRMLEVLNNEYALAIRFREALRRSSTAIDAQSKLPGFVVKDLQESGMKLVEALRKRDDLPKKDLAVIDKLLAFVDSAVHLLPSEVPQKP